MHLLWYSIAHASSTHGMMRNNISLASVMMPGLQSFKALPTASVLKYSAIGMVYPNLKVRDCVRHLAANATAPLSSSYDSESRRRLRMQARVQLRMQLRKTTRLTAAAIPFISTSSIQPITTQHLY